MGRTSKAEHGSHNRTTRSCRPTRLGKRRHDNTRISTGRSITARKQSVFFISWYLVAGEDCGTQDHQSLPRLEVVKRRDLITTRVLIICGYTSAMVPVNGDSRQPTMSKLFQKHIFLQNLFEICFWAEKPSAKSFIAIKIDIYENCLVRLNNQ